MDKKLKIEVVSQLKEVFSNASIVIVSRNKGVTVSAANDLRRKVREADSFYKVAKNSLVKIALKDTKFEHLLDLMAGPTAIAYSNDDPVAIAKAIQKFSDSNEKFEVVGGVMKDGGVLSPAQVKQLSSLPSLDELRGKIVGLLQAPASKIASVLQAPGRQVACVVKAYSDKK